MRAIPPSGTEQLRHSFAEDVGAIAVGSLLTSLGLALYSQQDLLTGGLAGFALLLTYASGLPFWLLFSLINLPFYALSIRRIGWIFTFRTFVAVTLVSALASKTGHWVSAAGSNAIYVTIIGGVLCGTGLLVLFRHRTGLGGINILALYLQEQFGIRARYFQLAVDLCILATAFLVVPLEKASLSIVGSVILNCIVAFNHKPGRYTATT